MLVLITSRSVSSMILGIVRWTRKLPLWAVWGEYRDWLFRLDFFLVCLDFLGGIGREVMEGLLLYVTRNYYT